MMRAHFDVLLGHRSSAHECAPHRLARRRPAGACRLRASPTIRGFQGWVEADLIFVSPDEAGRVETLSVREGDAVEKGAPLFTVDPELQQADVDMAKAVGDQRHARPSSARRRCSRPRPARRRRWRTPRRRCAPRRRGSLRRRPGWRAARWQARSTGSVQQIYYRPGETRAGRAAGGFAAAAGQHQDPVLRAGDGAAEGRARRGRDDPLRRLQGRRAGAR